MATSQMTKVVQHLRGAVLRDGAGMTDGQLLESFVRQRDDAAFAALVRRHGPMVWGVCRRLLRSHHDAEDAFQATFLVLARKAATIQQKELVANWLYGVAHQTSVKARALAAKRGVRERQVTEMTEPTVVEQGLWNDLQPLLDRELSHLPDKYRILIVLCDLEGKTRTDVAQQLGCPEGTVAGRLARARVMLAKRLARRGLSVTGGMLGSVLSARAASASAPASVVSSTIHAATLIAAGKVATAGIISANVAALTQGVLKAMFVTKLKLATAVLLLGVVFGAGVLATAQRGGAQPPLPVHPSAIAQLGGAQPAAKEPEGGKPVNGLAQDNPLANVKVGDWIVLKQSSNVMGKEVSTSIKQTITAEDKNRITVSQAVIVDGKESPGKETKFPADQFGDPLKMMVPNGAKLEKLKTGKENLTIKDKRVATEWTEYKGSIDVGGKTIDTTMKFWIAKDIPIMGGMAKMEMEFSGEKMTIEVTDYGRGK